MQFAMLLSLQLPLLLLLLLLLQARGDVFANEVDKTERKSAYFINRSCDLKCLIART